MKKILLTCVLLCGAYGYYVMFAYASGGGIPGGYAPNGKKNVTLTVNSITTNVKLDEAYAIFPQRTTCKFRIMSTATKAGAKQSLPALTRTILYVNKATPYINTTSCANGEMTRE